MRGYVIEISSQPLGAGSPPVERVYVLAEDEPSALTLVRVARQLSDERLVVVGALTEAQIREAGLKPFQVRHAP